MTKHDLVSIVMPMYNSVKYVREAIQSVFDQTYTNWELIVVDDCSNDGSLQLAEQMLRDDCRCKLLLHNNNYGAAIARNSALPLCRGQYVMFLDSDDVWEHSKIEDQLSFMKDAECAMSFTSYETIKDDGSHRNYVKVPDRIDYNGFLKNTITCSHTVCFDLSKIDVQWLRGPAGLEFDYPDDLAVWLNVLRHGTEARGINRVLAKNRKHSSSRSANKIRAIRRTWNQYRRIERMSAVYSVYCLFWQLFHAAQKRI